MDVFAIAPADTRALWLIGLIPFLVLLLVSAILLASLHAARSATFELIVVVPPTQRPARNATTSPSGSGAKRSGHQMS